MRPSGFPVRPPRRVFAALGVCLAASAAAGAALVQPALETRLRQIEARLSALEARLTGDSTAAAAPDASRTVAGAPVAGVYASDYGNVDLRQIGADVQGNYDLGRIFGRVEGDVFKGYWLKQGAGCTTEVMGTRNWGRLEFRFDPARRGFLGYYSYCDALPTSPWNGTRK